jgi:hypothetical protein
MCVVAVKHIPKFGWIGVKNRDRNYECEIEVQQSNRNGLQRLYIDDKLSRWTEGINEHGLSILSASFSVKSDEKEGEKITMNRQNMRANANFYSPDGKAIRDALKMKEPKKAAEYLIEKQLAGATFIFNQSECWLLEGGFNVRKEDATQDNPRKYIHKLKQISKDEGYVCRSNHGIDLPQLGYKENPTDPKLKDARISSEKRLHYAQRYVKLDMSDPSELLDAVSKTPDDNTFYIPIRTGDTKKQEMVTTGQLLLIPKEKSLAYRPIFSKVSFHYNKLNGPDAKTFFEVISTRKLLSFKEWSDK